MNTLLKAKQKTFITGIIPVILLLTGSLFNACSQAQTFTCDVNLNSFSVNNNVTDAKPDFSGKAHVTADYKNAKWIIDYIDNGQKFACSYFDYILEKPNHNGTNAWYIVSPVVEGYPIDLDFDQRLIWFAYCAKDYLQKKQGQPVIIPFGDTRLDCYVHASRMEAKWRSNADLCPETVQFNFDQDLFKKGVQQLTLEPPGSFLNNREIQFNHYIQYHTNGQTVAVFRVTQWTNIEGVSIPSAWQFDLYWYGEHSFICMGTADNIKAVERIIEPPDISPRTLITDKRVRNVASRINSVRYKLTNGVIPTLDGIKLSKNIAHDNFAQMPPNLRKIRIVLVSVIFITCIIPLAFWCYKKMVGNR